MSNDEKKAAILIMKAAADLRQAAAADDKRAAELLGVADYLGSIVYESELGYGEPLFPDSERADNKAGDEIKRMMKPFRIRLSR